MTSKQDFRELTVREAVVEGLAVVAAPEERDPVAEVDCTWEEPEAREVD